jgi:pSer/pThr/pTyr-binding forkhead associated (FHA) protein
MCYFTGEVYYLLVGKSHVVGRRDGDITLADDQSVSRRHAVITVEHNIKDLVRNFRQKHFMKTYIFHFFANR